MGRFRRGLFRKGKRICKEAAASACREVGWQHGSFVPRMDRVFLFSDPALGAADKILQKRYLS